MINQGFIHPFVDFLPILCEECFFENHHNHKFIKISKIGQFLFEHN